MKYKIEIRKIKDLLKEEVYLTNINMQRKYIYTHDQAKHLLDSIQKNIPIPALYLWDNNNGTYDVLDGKQRITVMRLFRNPDYLPDITINFFIDHMEDDFFDNYEIPVIVCEGTEQDKITTFKRINTTAVQLKDFEIYNALYQGTFVEEFGNWGVNLSEKEIKFFGKGIRGENCIKAIKLFTNDVESFFKFNKDASFTKGLKIKIDNLVNVADSIFHDYAAKEDFYILAKIILENIGNDSLIKSLKLNKNKIIDLFAFYKENGELKLAPSKESFYKEMLGCYNVTGLDSKRFFSAEDRKSLFNSLEKGSGGKRKCPICGKEFGFDEFEVDHIKAWSKGGQTKLSNAQIMCSRCNEEKGNR